MQPDVFTYVDPSPPPVAEGGKLAGRAVAIQPNVSVRGWPTEAGSLALEGFVALEDATVIARLRQAGARVVGSTRMGELGLGLAGDTSGRSLAEGRADVALVTDTLGEARVAAATVGVCCLKPSHGLISRLGLIGLVPSMECYGILARTPGEIAVVAEAIAGRDERDSSMPDCETPDFGQVGQEPLESVGVIRQCVAGLEPAEVAALRAALARLERAGVEVQELDLADYDLLRAVHNVVGAVEASSSAGKYDSVRYGHRTASARDWNEMYLRSRAESFRMPLKAYLFQGAYFQFEAYDAFEDACRIRARLLRETESLFDTVQALALPTRRFAHDAAAAATVAQVYDAFALTLLANVNGQPAVQVPGLALDGETDLGLQLVGPRLGDAQLLASAVWLSRLDGGDD